MFQQVKNHTPKNIYPESLYAVMIPLIKVNDEYHILFEVRSSHLDSQPHDICFPGGKIEKEDASILEGAIREVKEELCIQDHNIIVYGELDYFYGINNMKVHAFLGELIDYSYTYNEEVESVFTVPLQFFLETKPQIYYCNTTMKPENDFPEAFKEYPFFKGKMETPFYTYKDKIIWGLTARLLYHNLDLLK